MLDENILKHLAKFYSAYAIVLDGSTTFDDLKRVLIRAGMPETTARRYISEFHYPFCSALLEQGNGGRVSVNQEGMEQLVYDIADWLGVAIIPQNIHDAQMAEISKARF